MARHLRSYYEEGRLIMARHLRSYYEEERST